MAMRSREGNLAFWSIRLLRALNLLIILGSIAFLTFEIQFEPHPAEFGWSLIMIAIITMLSGVIGCVSSVQNGCFFPLMFFTFVSLMGLFSLSVLLFARPDEVARKMLTFHISLTCAMHHLFIDAYFFSLLGFLQLLIFTLAYIVHKRAFIQYYEDVDIPLQQSQLSPAEDPACNKFSMTTSAAMIISKGSKEEAHQTQSSSPSRWKADAQFQLDQPIPNLSSGGGAVQESATLSPKEASAAAEVFRKEDLEVQKRMSESLLKSLQDLCSTSSWERKAECGGRAEVVESEISVPGDDHQHASSLSNSRNPKVTIYSSSSWSARDRRAWSETSPHSSSSLSSCECQYSISKETDLNVLPFSAQQQVSTPVAAFPHVSLRLYLIALILGTFINLTIARFKPARIRTRLTSGAAAGDVEVGVSGSFCHSKHSTSCSSFTL